MADENGTGDADAVDGERVRRGVINGQKEAEEEWPRGEVEMSVYQQMCKEAGLKWEPKVGDAVISEGKVVVVIQVTAGINPSYVGRMKLSNNVKLWVHKDFLDYLPREEDLWGMLPSYKERNPWEFLEYLHYFSIDDMNEYQHIYLKQFKTMKALLLAMVMHELHAKRWEKGGWV